MITAYITLSPNREIISVNQSLEGCARHAYGMGPGKLDDVDITYQNIADRLEDSPSVTIHYEDGAYTIERHFIAA